MVMITESLRQAKTAMSLASTPADRALFCYQRGQALLTFGFPLDAVVAFRQAAALDPSSRQILHAESSTEAGLRTGGLAE